MYSDRIRDPAFRKYIRDANRYAQWFSLGLAIVAVLGFAIYGQVSDEMDDPQAMGIGLAIGAMFLAIGIGSTRGRKKSTTWDGTVIDKSRRRTTKRTGSSWAGGIEYTVTIQSDSGTLVHLTAEDDATVYDYYKVGDRVRRHQGLNSFEKFDKTGDSIIFCNACATLNDIREETCWRCSCPLLK